MAMSTQQAATSNSKTKLRPQEIDSWRCTLEEMNFEYLYVPGGGGKRFKSGTKEFSDYCEKIEMMVAVLPEPLKQQALEIAVDFDYEPEGMRNASAFSKWLRFTIGRADYVVSYSPKARAHGWLWFKTFVTITLRGVYWR